METEIAIKNIRDIEFHCRDPFEIVTGFDPDKAPLITNLKVNYRWNLEKDLFGVLTYFSYTFEHNNEVIELLKYSCITEFEVKNLNKINPF